MKKLFASILLVAALLPATAMEVSRPVRAARAQSSPAMKAAPSRDDITGDYTIQYYDLTIITQSLYTNETTLTAGSTASQVVLTIPFINQSIPYTMDVKGTYDPETGVITFTSKGQVAFGADITFYLYDEDTDKENAVPSITCSWNGNGFTFNPNYTIGLPAGGNSFYFKGGYFSLTSVADEPDTDPMEGWTTVGMGKLQDGWLLPAFKDIDQTEYVYPVEIQSKDGEEGVYRVVNPYGANSPVAKVNESKAAYGFIQFNVTDPGHVYFYGTEAGFANSELGITKFYPNNILGNLIGYLPEFSIEEILSEFGAEDGFMSTTYADGVVTLPSVAASAGGFDNDANFGVQGAQFAGNGWMSNGKPKNMEAKIFMPETGIEAISADTDISVRYFNLQGVEVSRPCGGVFIRVQGHRVTKVVLPAR